MCHQVVLNIINLWSFCCSNKINSTTFPALTMIYIYICIIQCAPSLSLYRTLKFSSFLLPCVHSVYSEVWTLFFVMLINNYDKNIIYRERDRDRTQRVAVTLAIMFLFCINPYSTFGYQGQDL